MTSNLDPNGLQANELGAKFDLGKPRADLLLQFSRALEAVAKVATFGTTKYTDGGWQHVKDGISRYKAAGIRHLLKETREPIDPESGLPHIFHRVWNNLAELELTLREAERSPDPPQQLP